MDKQPKIPTLKDAQKPQVKIKGLGAGLTLFDRLKQFKKKDLAFILAGLGTLFLAPLVEHFMMSPESGDGRLEQGWGGGKGSGAGIFGGGGSPYESGGNGIASGGAVGGAGDIITPLNVRDPSSLVMAPGGAQQPPAGSAAPAAPPPGRSDSDLKDALAGAASRAASAAIKKAPLPIPKIALGGSGLRGLGVAGGGSSAASSLAPIKSDLGGQAGTGGGGLNLVRSGPGFRGAAGPRGSSNPLGLDSTKKAGQNAGDAFSRTGSALGALNEAARENIPTGGSGFSGSGQGGAGPNDKNPGGSGAGGSKSVGESLAFIAAKERMMKNLELEFEKKKLRDPELLWLNLRNDALKTISGGIAKAMTEHATDLLKSFDPAAANPMITCPPLFPNTIPLATARRSACTKENLFNCFMCKPSGCDGYRGLTEQAVSPCSLKPDTGANPNPQSRGGGVDQAGMVSGGLNAALSGKIEGVCRDLDALKGKGGTVPPTTASTLDGMRAEAGRLMAVSDALGGKTEICAGADKKDLLGAADPLQKQHRTAFDTVLGAGTLSDSGLLGKLSGLAGKPEGDVPSEEVKTLAEGAATSKKLLDAVIADAGEDLGKITPEKGTVTGETSRDKVVEYQKTIAQARDDIKTRLSNHISAQKLLDEKIVKDMNDIAGADGGTLKKVIAVNSGYKEIEDPLKKVTAAQKDYKADKDGVTSGEAEAKAAVETAKPIVKTILAAEPDETKRTAELNTKTEVKTAKGAVEGLRKAQTTWIGSVKADATAGSGLVPKMSAK